MGLITKGMGVVLKHIKKGKKIPGKLEGYVRKAAKETQAKKLSTKIKGHIKLSPPIVGGIAAGLYSGYRHDHHAKKGKK